MNVALFLNAVKRTDQSMENVVLIAVVVGTLLISVPTDAQFMNAK